MPNSGAGELEYKTAATLGAARDGSASPSGALVAASLDGEEYVQVGSTHPFYDLKNDPAGTVWAIVAVTGVRDEVDDIIVPGAFRRSLAEREMKGVKGHDWNRPVAVQRNAVELMPGDDRLPARMPNGAPWPSEAGALAVKASHILGTADGHAAWQEALAFGTSQAYSIGYKVSKAKQRGDVRYIYDLDVYEFSPVLHGANKYATLQAVKGGDPEGLETGDLDDFEGKARGGLRRVADAAYWGLPVGTVITAGMKPRGPRARAGARDRGPTQRAGQRGVGGGMGENGTGGIRRDTGAAMRARDAARLRGNATVKPDGTARRMDYSAQREAVAAATNGVRGDQLDDIAEPLLESAAREVERGDGWRSTPQPEKARALRDYLRDRAAREEGLEVDDGETPAQARARKASSGNVRAARANIAAGQKRMDEDRSYSLEARERRDAYYQFGSDGEKPIIASDDGKVAAVHLGNREKGTGKNKTSVSRGWLVVNTQTGDILGRSEPDDDVEDFVDAANEALIEKESGDGRAGGTGAEALRDGVQDDAVGGAGAGDRGLAGAGDRRDGGPAGGAGPAGRGVPGEGRTAADRTDDGAVGGAAGAAADGRAGRAGGDTGGDGVRRGDDGGRAGADGAGAADAVDDAGLAPDGVSEDDVPEPDLQAAGKLDAITGENFAPQSMDDLAPAGVKAKLAANMAALRTLRDLQRPREGRRPGTRLGDPDSQVALPPAAATPEQQAILAKWAGWGGLPKVFDDSFAEYATERAELRGLMSESEWNEARRNTLNAHYTDARATAAVWDAMKELGFDGGRVLEPGSGSGNFIGFAPEGTDMVGVELDSTTAGISKYLYPNASIRNESFAKTRVPDGSFDAAIGNVPFGKFSLHDPIHNKAGASIHNHFIEKSLALTRPGGMVAVLTSRFTMDSQDSSARERMAELGDLVGAVRLPTGSHRRASGTDVIEDVLIFRRREEGAPPADQSWVKSKKTELNGWDIQVNPYWAAHPDRVLGQMEGVKGQYGGDLRVVGDRDMGDLPAALAGIVADAKRRDLTMTPRQEALPELIGPDTSRHEGHMQLEPDGSISQASRGAALKVDVPAKQRAEVAALLGLRNAMRDLLAEEAASGADTPGIAARRADLNAAYDAYVRKFGPLNRVTVTAGGQRRTPPAVAIARRDPSMAMVRALENYDPNGNGGKGSATKGSIFTKRAAAPRELATTAANGADALALSMDAYGEVRLPEIARMLGVDEDEARDKLRGLVHEIPALSAEEEDAAAAYARAVEAGTADPLTPGGPMPEGLEGLRDVLREPGTLVPRAEMLSGNVRRKLAIARAAAAVDPRFRNQVADLEEALPADLSTGEIEARLGAAWITPETVQQFARELSGDRNMTVRSVGSGAWVVDGGKKGVTATDTWGTDRMAFGEIIEALLLQKAIKRTTKGPDGKYRTDADATIAAQSKGEQIQERFAEWIWEDPDRARKLQSDYNWSFNSLVLRNYDGVKRTFPGMAEGFEPFGHQHAAVERIVNDPTAMLAHVVGAGKTAEMVMGTQELKRLGLARKPAIIIPNHMLEQFTREYLEIYPNAKILAAGTDDLEGEKRREFVARAAVGDWDAVILTQNAFESIPMSADGRADYVNREVAEMRAQLDAAKAAGLDSDDKSVKEMEKSIQSAEAQLEKLLDSKSDEGGVTFEETGIDYLMVDEAHHYSNLRTVTRIPNAGAAGSKKATDLHMKMEHLRATTESGRVATFATGTPIRNTMTQTYIMQRFLRPDLLREAGIDSFDQWAATFGETVEEPEISPTGKVRTNTRFSKFRNVPELLRMMHQFADVKMAEDLKLPTPTLRGGRAESVVVAGTPELDDYIRWLGERADAVRNGEVEPDEDNMLSVSMDGRKAALSMSLVSEPDDVSRANKIMQPHQPGKIEAAADKIHGIWGETKDRVYPLNPKDPDAGDDPNPGSLQIVFLDLGTPNDEGRFDAYDLMRRELAARGMDASRVRFMHEAKNDAEKAQMFADARNGKIDVLIGSTEKMGVGTNVQKRAVALHHIDAPWRPSDVEQREGRIMRQGNLNKNLGHDVRILQYVTEGSFDTYMWQTLQRKAKFIGQVMRGRIDVREMEDIGDSAMNFAEVKALASGNPELLSQAKIDTLKNKLERLSRTHARSQANMERDIGKFTGQVADLTAAATALEAAIERRTDTRGGKFQFTMGDGESYRDRADAAAALQPELSRLRRELRRRLSGSRSEPVGRIGGHTLVAEYRDDRKRGPVLALTLEGVPGDIVTMNDSEVDGMGPGVMVRIDNFLAGMDARRASALDREAHLRSEIEKMSSAVGHAFPKARELEAARQKSTRLMRKIDLDARRKEDGLDADAVAQLEPDHPLAFDPMIDTDVADDPILEKDSSASPSSDKKVPVYRPRSRTAPTATDDGDGEDLGDDAEWDDGLGSVDIDGTIVPPAVAERPVVAPQTTAPADTTGAARADADDAVENGDAAALEDALARMGVPETDAAPGGADRTELAEALVTLPDTVRDLHLDRIETGGTEPAERPQVAERQAERRAELADTGGPLVSRVNKLTAANLRALRETGAAREVGGTYAVFDGNPDEAMARVQQAAADNPDWRASLASVLRKLRNREDRFVSVTNAPDDDGSGTGGTPAPATRSDADDDESIIFAEDLAAAAAVTPAADGAAGANRLMILDNDGRRAVAETMSTAELDAISAEMARRDELIGSGGRGRNRAREIVDEIRGERHAADPTSGVVQGPPSPVVGAGDLDTMTIPQLRAERARLRDDPDADRARAREVRTMLHERQEEAWSAYQAMPGTSSAGKLDATPSTRGRRMILNAMSDEDLAKTRADFEFEHTNMGREGLPSGGNYGSVVNEQQARADAPARAGAAAQRRADAWDRSEAARAEAEQRAGLRPAADTPDPATLSDDEPPIEDPNVGRTRQPYQDKPGAAVVPLTPEQATLARYRFEDMLTGDQVADDELGAYTSDDGRQLLVHNRTAALAEIDTALEILDENLDPPGGRRSGDREDFARWRAEQRRWQQLRRRVDAIVPAGLDLAEEDDGLPETPAAGGDRDVASMTLEEVTAEREQLRGVPGTGLRRAELNDRFHELQGAALPEQRPAPAPLGQVVPPRDAGVRLDQGFRERVDPMPGASSAERDAEVERLRGEIEAARRRTGETGASTLQRRIELQERIDAVDANRAAGEDQGGLFDGPSAAPVFTEGGPDLDRDFLSSGTAAAEIDSLLNGEASRSNAREDRLYEVLGRIGVEPDQRDRVMDQLIGRETSPDNLVEDMQQRFRAENTANDVSAGDYLVSPDPRDKAATLFEQRPAHAEALAALTPDAEAGEVADELERSARGTSFEAAFAPTVAVLRGKAGTTSGDRQLTDAASGEAWLADAMVAMTGGQDVTPLLNAVGSDPGAQAWARGAIVSRLRALARRTSQATIAERNLLADLADGLDARIAAPAAPDLDPRTPGVHTGPGPQITSSFGMVAMARWAGGATDEELAEQRAALDRMSTAGVRAKVNDYIAAIESEQDRRAGAPTMAEQDGADFGLTGPAGSPPMPPRSDVDAIRRANAAAADPSITEDPADDRTPLEREADDRADAAAATGTPMAELGGDGGAPVDDAPEPDAPEAEAPDEIPADAPAAPAGPPAGGQELDAETIETIQTIEADALGLVEGDDGELEVTDDVADRQARVEETLDRASRGELDIAGMADSELGDGRRDAVDELRLQEVIARRDRERTKQRRSSGGGAGGDVATTGPQTADGGDGEPVDDASAAGAETVPDAAPAGPKRRPGLAGALEDLADAMDNGLDPDAVAAGKRRARTALARSRGDSEAHRQLAAELDRLDESGEIANPDRLRELATTLREEARTRRNSQARSRRLAKRLERERLRSLIGQYDAEIRNRGRNPDDFGGTPPTPIDSPDGPSGQGGDAPDDGDGGSGGGGSGPAPAAPAGQAAQAAPQQSAVDLLPQSFDRSDPDGPQGQARTTALVDGLTLQPWRLYGPPAEAFGGGDAEQMERVKAAGREAYGPVLDRFGPMVRKRPNADHDAAANTVAEKRAAMADPSKADAAGMTLAYMIPRESRREYIDAISAATILFREKSKPPPAPAARRPAGVEVARQKNGRLQVRSPRDDRFIDGVKAMGGAKWDRYRKAWTVPSRNAEALDALIEKVYGGPQADRPDPEGTPAGDVVFLSDMPDGVTIRSNGTDMLVRSPYSDAFRLSARELGGTWDRAERGWRFPEGDHDRVIGLVHSVYGTTQGRPPGPGDRNPGAGQRASEADVVLASRLIDRIGLDGYRHLTDRQWETPPSVDALRGWPATEVSALLAKLRLMTRSSEGT